MKKTIFGRMWLVGKSYGENWSLLPDSYLFSTKAEAIAWEELYLLQHPLVGEDGAFLVLKEVEISEVVRSVKSPVRPSVGWLELQNTVGIEHF